MTTSLLDDYKIKKQGFSEPSPINWSKVVIDRVDQGDHFDPGMTSVGHLPPTQFKDKLSKLAFFFETEISVFKRL